MKVINSEQVENYVFAAIENGSYLEVGKPILLEILCEDYDGIFENKKSWQSFINGNFRFYGEIYLSGEPKDSTIKKWCLDLNEYKDLFVVKVGVDKYIKVDSEDLDFEFHYDCNFFTRDSNFPCQVEIYATANFKG